MESTGTHAMGGAPLAGRTIVVTRAMGQAGSLADPLTALGAEVVSVPVIAIVDPPDLDRFDDALRRLADYDWVILSSANGVDRFMDRLVFVDRTAGALSGVRIAVVGSATARRLRERGVEPDLVPQHYRQEGMVEAFRALDLPAGTRVMFARAFEGRDVLVDALVAAGLEVDLVAAYTTIPATATPEVLERLTARVDVVTFTSPSTVRNFFAFLEANGVDGAELMASAEAASIGPVTTRALLERGVEPGIEPSVSTVPDLIDAIVDFYDHA